MVAVFFDPLRSVAAGGIGATYATLGTAFTHRVRILKITNLSDGDVLISFDGETDNDVVPAGSFVLYDMTTNSPAGAEVDQLVLAIGTQIYVKDGPTAPANGSVYATAVRARFD